ncbi:MAG: hypothetical protein INR62_05290 [Rhodospirillales bacterium]|nr:hypothetical protein [Acetobacter sp.]
MKPAPAILQGGNADDIVSTQSQVDTMQYVYALNQCTNSYDWYGADAGTDPVPQAHASYTNNRLVTWLFEGGHQFVQPYETDQIVTFFKTATSVSLPFFDGEVSLGNGVYYLQFPDRNIFGYYAFLADPHYLYHFDLGYEYVFDAKDGQKGVYLYDFTSGHFFYTSPTFPFPYLYDFTLNAVLYYYADPNNPGRYNTNGTRYFYNFATGQIITE